MDPFILQWGADIPFQIDKMNQNQEVLRAFLSEKLQAQGLAANETLLNGLLEHVVIREGQSDVNEEERAIEIKKGTDNKTSATRISAFNLLELSFTDVFDLVLAGGGVTVMGGASKLAYTFAICALLNEFIKKATTELNETDAKILLALYQLGKKSFQPEELQASYVKEFGEPLAADQLQRSLDAFKKGSIIRYKGDNNYQLRERMTYERP